MAYGMFAGGAEASITFSTACPLTAGLVAGLMNDNQSEVTQYTSMIHARNDINQNPQFTAAVENIASGISFGGGPDIGGGRFA